VHKALLAVTLCAVAVSGKQRPAPPAADVSISGELRQWHKVTLTAIGPQADELSTAPNPFMDYRMMVTFAHESGTPTYRVPGYFAGVAAAHKRFGKRRFADILKPAID